MPVAAVVELDWVIHVLVVAALDPVELVLEALDPVELVLGVLDLVELVLGVLDLVELVLVVLVLVAPDPVPGEPGLDVPVQDDIVLALALDAFVQGALGLDLHILVEFDDLGVPD